MVVLLSWALGIVLFLKDIILRDDLQSLVIFLENAGLVDAKSVCITFDLGIHQMLLRIEKFVMNISLKDSNDNEYKATSDMTLRLKQALKVIALPEAEFASTIIDLYEPDAIPKDQEIAFSYFEQKDPIEMEADGRSYPILMPIAK